MSELRDLMHPYNQGYWDGKQGKPKSTYGWTGDQLALYEQGYAEGSATVHPEG